jgi:hypothetical protein
VRRLSRDVFGPAFGLLCWQALLACAPGESKSPGEVVVVVTTDMVVPDDIDTLDWSVTVVGDEAPVKQGSVNLQSMPLPATLALVSGDEAPGPVWIEIDGSRAGSPRVTRRARVSLPPDGEVNRLTMPLDWLCSHDASPSLGCGADETCQAGECVQAAISELSRYSPPDAGACFDTSTCFAQPAGVFVAKQDPVTGVCVVPDQSFSSDVNVALQVATSTTGNYGACGIAGSCLVALARGGPEGWTALTDDGGAVTIGLPAAVCNDMGVTVSGVVIAQASSTCPAKSPESSPCRSNDTCITASVCPPGWGSDWVGYSCSGSATPLAVDPGVQACWGPSAALDDGGGAGGRSCCAVGTGGPPGSLLIDDMSGGPQVKVAPPPGDIAGFWWTDTDDPHSPLIPPPLGLFTYTAVAPPMTLDGGPMNAACLTSPMGFAGLFAQEGFNFVEPEGKLSPTGDPFDVSAYTGIRFLAWSRYSGQSIKVSFADIDTEAEDPSSTCNQLGPDAGGCGNDWAVQNLELTDVWARYTVRWDQLTQANWGPKVAQFDPKHVFTTVFVVAGLGPDEPDAANPPYPPFEFCVSQIYFTE